MSVGEVCNREVVITARETPIPEVAGLMRRHHVGTVVVTEAGKPVGILTDRDIVVGPLAAGSDPAAVSAGEAMSRKLFTVGEDWDLLEAVARMREKGVRRMPVVDQGGALVGILAVDDLIELLVEQLDDLVGLVAAAARRERERRD